MGTQLRFDEPDIFLGETRLSHEQFRFYLPLATVLSHTLLISRSGGGKSHTLAILAMGLAKAAAVRRLNLLTAITSRVGHHLLGSQSPANLISVVASKPPLSLCVFDPHRDLAKRLLEDLTRLIASTRVRRHRDKSRVTLLSNQPQIPNWEDVLEGMITYLDLGDRENIFGLNLLDTAMWESKENCASTLIEIFRRIYPDAWGSRMEDCFRHSVFALYLLNTQRKREEQFTILDIIAFITTDHWREALLEHPVISQENPVIGAWWKIQFADKMSENFRNEVIKPVLNKLNPFLGSDILSRIFGQARTTLDFEPLIRQGNIVLIDLAASEIETENCALAGAILMGFLLKKVRHIADGIGRVSDRPAIQLMVDEFNVLLAAPYTEIMGQYRKWGVGATLATQSLTLLDELDPTLRPLVMANAANLMVLQVNAEDAEYLRKELVSDGTTSSRGGGLNGVSGSLSSLSAGGGGSGPDLYDLVNAERGMCYLKGTFDNIREQVFTVKVADRPFQNSQVSPQGKTGEIEQERISTVNRLMKRCRQKYTLPAEDIRQWLNQKQQDYSRLYRLELLDPASSPLLSGFVSWQTELAAGLESRLKRAQEELEEERFYRAKNRNRRRNQREENKARDDQPKQAAEQANQTASGQSSQKGNTPPPGKPESANKVPQASEATGKPIKSKKEPDKVSQKHAEIPKYAPGYNGKPLVRKPASHTQTFQETRKMPDGKDYTPAGQVREQRKKDKKRARRRQKTQREIEAIQSQGQAHHNASQSQKAPGSGSAKQPERNTN